MLTLGNVRIDLKYTSLCQSKWEEHHAKSSLNWLKRSYMLLSCVDLKLFILPKSRCYHLTV